MIDFLIVGVSLAAIFMGSGYWHLRILIGAGLTVSSLFYQGADYFDVVQSLDPGIFYFNFMLPLLLFFLSLQHINKFTKLASYSFILIALANFLTYLEYYTGGSLFYDVYEESMLALTAWQLWLLIRIGNVSGNIRRWSKYFNTDHRRNNRSLASNCHNGELGQYEKRCDEK